MTMKGKKRRITMQTAERKAMTIRTMNDEGKAPRDEMNMTQSARPDNNEREAPQRRARKEEISSLLTY
jgi:hypothetical protein